MRTKVLWVMTALLLSAGWAFAQDDSSAKQEMMKELEKGPQAGAGEQPTPPFGEKYWDLKKNLAYAQQQAGEMDKASAVYEEILEAGRMDEKTRLRYAWVLNSRGDHQKAWEVLAPLPMPSKDLRTLELQAKTAYWAEKWDQASKLLETYLERTQGAEGS